MALADHVTAYYDALRNEEPLASFFAERDDLVKFGINEQLRGYEEVADGLAQQTERTTDWRVESHQLVTGDHDDAGWFSDLVTMGWTDTEREESYELETRWSGTAVTVEGDWRFAGMHVSMPYAYSDQEDALDEDLIDG